MGIAIANRRNRCDFGVLSSIGCTLTGVLKGKQRQDLLLPLGIPMSRTENSD